MTIEAPPDELLDEGQTHISVTNLEKPE